MASVPSPNRLFYDVLGPGQARGSSSPPGQHGCFPPLEDSMGAFRNMPPYNTPQHQKDPPNDIVMPRANRNERTRHGSSPP